MLSRQAGYEELYRTHHERIVRLCRLLLKDRSEAEEAAQEVFLKLLRASKEPLPGAWEAWLTRVAVNMCRDRQRSWWWKGRKEDSMALPDIHLSSNDPTPEETTVRREERERIWHFFRKLSLRQQEVFVLRYVEGWSGEEVAKILGVTAGSVKQHLFRAVHQMRKALGDHV